MALSSAAASRMRKEYGESPAQRCRNCCNCQLKRRSEQSKICIGYSLEEPWDDNSIACGLFNIAFEGLRPRRRRLEEMYPTKPKNYKSELAEGQDSLF